MLVSPIASGAMSQVLYCLAEALQESLDLTIVAPAHFEPPPRLRESFIPLPTPSGRIARAAYWISPSSMVDILRIVRRETPDVIHFLNGLGYLPAVLLPRIIPSIPCVVTVHDPIAHSGAHVDNILGFVARKTVLPRAALIHAFSDFAKQSLIQQGFSPEKISWTRLGALTEVFSKHDSPSVTRGQSLLFFGRWEHYKGIDILIDAVVALANQGLTQHCILAGPGTVSRETYAKIAEYPELFEVHNRYLSDQEVAHLFQRANRLLLPYRDATQSTLPALAQAYKLLIIATRVGAFTEEIEELGGLLAAPDSVQEIVLAIRKSISMQAPAEQCIDYSWALIAKQLKSVYVSSLNGSHRIN